MSCLIRLYFTVIHKENDGFAKKRPILFGDFNWMRYICY
jgi:hypothetical protein